MARVMGGEGMAWARVMVGEVMAWEG